ncbi:MAG: prepilin-type N-terminal cleavage/methylation domain-containing protein [Burkholderiales bacterium]|nr:prepilin-type N-terminal cleavage/methylation domain-containing protein [Burkholderiales bacterium]
MRSARAGDELRKGTARRARSLSRFGAAAPRRASRGFTLAELVAGILIAAILAAGASALFSRLTFETAGFADQLRSTVAYAQKVAIAQRRTVFVVTTAGSAAACYDAGCATPIASPTGSALVLTAPSGVTVSPATSFSFNGLGQPSFGAALTLSVTGDGARSFTVEPDTGYVR